MICQDCGSRPAMIHLEELTEGRRSHAWLCEVCAGKRERSGMNPDGLDPDELDSEREDFDFDDPSGAGNPAESDFTSFLGQMFETRLDDKAGADICPSCGFTLGDLGQTNRLGCATCYDHFRDRLLPLLIRIHRHSSHLGRGPRLSEESISQQGEIARHRVALEKAIVAERFEDAARLRDLIGRLEGEQAAARLEDAAPQFEPDPESESTGDPEVDS